MFQIKAVEGIKTCIICSTIFLYRAVFEIMCQKYCRAGKATDDNTAHAHCTLDTQDYKHTRRIYNTYCLSTATVATLTHLNVTLHVHRLSCMKLFSSHKNLVAGHSTKFLLAAANSSPHRLVQKYELSPV